MAFAPVRSTEAVSTENKVFHRYVGICPMRVIAVNPTMEELKGIYGENYKRDSVYQGEVDYTHPVSNETYKVRTMKIRFILKNDELDLLTNVDFNLKEVPFVSKAGKVQVIDRYGRTAWVTKEEFQQKAIPLAKNGKPVRIDKDYQMAYQNQEELIKFIKYLCGIQDVDYYDRDNKEWKQIELPDLAVAYIEDLKALFDYNFKELRDIVKLAEKNLIKVLLGVKIVDGKVYQDVYNRDFVRNRSSYYRDIERSAKGDQEVGRYINTIFDFCDVRVYDERNTGNQVIKPVDNPFAAPIVGNPFGAPAQPSNTQAIPGLEPQVKSDLPF